MEILLAKGILPKIAREAPEFCFWQGSRFARPDPVPVRVTAHHVKSPKMKDALTLPGARRSRPH